MPSFKGLRSASIKATAAARGASRKRDTGCERLLRTALHRRGARYRIDAADLPGRPDIVFRSARVAVFVDGDFWHGRNLVERLAKLERGHNAPYWIAKIKRNVERDVERTSALEAAGWRVMRFWEKDVAKNADEIAARILECVGQRTQ